jgi:diguanylate cyclase
VYQVELSVAVQSAQAVFSLILAGLLLAFVLEFRHLFLKHWAMSCLAMALYFASSAAIMELFYDDTGQQSVPPALTAFSLSMGYLHVIWLVIGAWEAVTDRAVRQWLQPTLIILALGVGIATVIAVPLIIESDTLRQLLRYTLLHAVTGLAFVISAVMLWRSLREFRLLSSRLVPLAFGSYGIFQLHASGISTWIPPGSHYLSHSPWVSLLGFLLQILIGYSMIIWLLELERRRSTQAHSKAQSAEERLVHFHMHDPATGLPNRRQLQDQLVTEVGNATEKRNRVAVLVIGIHRFKLITQALGWHETDRLVRKLTTRLAQHTPADAVIGRIGERDFLVILPNAGTRERAREKARKMIEASSKPIIHNGQEIFLSLSGGLSVAPDHEIDAVALIDLAQQAQMRAAASGSVLAMHQGHKDSDAPHDLLQLERELRRGVAEGQFVLYFQPLVNLRQRRITGFETLLRWNHPKRGVLTPGSFLQEAVRLGVLDELEDQILKQALGQLAEWQNNLSLPPISVSINLSAQRFQQPDLAEKLADLCATMNVDPADLHVEITESAAMHNFEAGLNTIAHLRELGCKVCLDDFGTGYSSLAHLRRLQVDYVKLDRSFISNLERDPRERDLTRAIVDLIHSLGMTVLAEGVETRQQLGYMIQCRVDVVQGFLMGVPRPIEDYLNALDRPQLIFD